ncbi:hypothetical protein JCM13664_17590 [Methylothermus subterraneus]
MKSLSGYWTIGKLLLGIYWLVMRQWCYVSYRKLTQRLGSRGTVTTP